MGRCDKGQINSNGTHLLEFARRNNLVLTNTLFNHKVAHISTSICPDKASTSTNRIISNQIDYILVETKDRNDVTNARAYSGQTLITN